MSNQELIEKLKELRKVMDDFIEGGSGYPFVMKFLEIHQFIQQMATPKLKWPTPPRADDYVI